MMMMILFITGKARLTVEAFVFLFKVSLLRITTSARCLRLYAFFVKTLNTSIIFLTKTTRTTPNRALKSNLSITSENAFKSKLLKSQDRSDDFYASAVVARAVGSVCRRRLAFCRVPKRDEIFFRRRRRAFAVFFFVNESIAFVARKRRHHLTRNHPERKRRRNDDVMRGIFVRRR